MMYVRVKLTQIYTVLMNNYVMQCLTNTVQFQYMRNTQREHYFGTTFLNQMANVYISSASSKYKNKETVDTC